MDYTSPMEDVSMMNRNSGVAEKRRGRAGDVLVGEGLRPERERGSQTLGIPWARTRLVDR